MATDESVTEPKRVVEATYRAAIASILNIQATSSDLLAEVNNLRKLRDGYSDLAHAEGQWTNAVTSKSTAADPEEFLQCLDFRSMDDRKDAIPEAHARTYQWLLLNAGKHHTSERSWSYSEERTRLETDLVRALHEIGIDVDIEEDPLNLRTLDRCPDEHLQHWLESEDGIFWIWGKPGCGKSTLMKAMLRKTKMKKRLEDLLLAWSAEQSLLIASFFFFRPGMSLQKSHVGFLRSLLYQILKQRHSMITEIFTAKEQRAAIARMHKSIDEEDVWSIEELRRAFRKWRRLDSSKLYLHIDGIDEIDSNPLDTIEILTDTANHEHVKVLAAGRWTPEFHDALQRTLGLHETTGLDILQFVADRLRISRVLNVLDNVPVQFLLIVKEIVSAAQGVFQWVSIVVESLIHGVRRFENFKQLHDRLREYPEDLDRLYWVCSNQFKHQTFPNTPRGKLRLLLHRCTTSAITASLLPLFGLK